MNKKAIVKKCQRLLLAYKNGELGQTVMPEDSNPGFGKKEKEQSLVYFSLPMALNYQRNSYSLWESALATYNDVTTRGVFNLGKVSKISEEGLRAGLLKHHLALQPNKHIHTWKKISETVFREWGSFEKLLEFADYDFLKLREIVQLKYKKGFPYLSGPKIYNYWCFVLNTYCDAKLKNSWAIEVAPDTHITKCSVRLGVITAEESDSLTKDEISGRWREVLEGSEINPIDMHAPLWFWSHNGFVYDLRDDK